MEQLQAILFLALAIFSLVTLGLLLKMAAVKLSLMDRTALRQVLEAVVSVAGQKVLMTQQTLISNLRKEVSEGTVTAEKLPDALVEVKQKTMSAIVRDTTALGLWTDVIAAMGGEVAAANWLSDLIESQVAQLPSSGLSKAAEAAKAKDVGV